MTDELHARIASEIGPVFWRDLRAHAARNGLILVAADLDLEGVARAVVDDDSAKIERWLQSGLLSRPKPAQIQTWDAALDTPFRSVVVQPFALAQAAAGPRSGNAPDEPQ
ncbi:MAG: DUF2288 family protein [Polyangiaceae bacterium]